MQVESGKLVLAGFIDGEGVAEPFVGFSSGDKFQGAEGMTRDISLGSLKGTDDANEMFSKESQRQWVKSYVGYISALLQHQSDDRLHRLTPFIACPVMGGQLYSVRDCIPHIWIPAS